MYILSGSWYIYTNGSAESTFDTPSGKNHIGMIDPDRSLIRCFFTWISALLFIVVNAIIPNRAAISQLIRNDSTTDITNIGRFLISAITGTFIMSDPIRRIGSMFWKMRAMILPMSSARNIPNRLIGFIISVATDPFSTLCPILLSTFVIRSTERADDIMM